MERSLPFVCPAVRCGLTAIRYPLSADRYPLSVEMVFPNEVIDFRLSDFRLQTLDSIDFTYHSGVPPFGGWRHHLARWEACHWIRGSPTAPL